MNNHCEAIDRLYVDVLLEQLNTRSNRTVLRYRHTDITGDNLRRAIFRYARALESLGIGRGSVVALLAANCPDALAIRYAANTLGSTTIFLPALGSAERQKVLIDRISPTLLVVFAETAHLVANGCSARVVSVGTGADASRIDKFAQVCSDQPLQPRAMPDDVAVLVSSGGTTGVPKCSRRSFAGYTAMVKPGKADDRRQLINGPLAYISQVLVDSTLTSGGTVVLEDHYDAAGTLAAIESERITDVLLIEPQLFETMDHPDARWRDLSSLRSIAHVGGSAPPTLRQRAIERFGPVLTHLYGASEAGIVSVVAPPRYAENATQATSAGRIVDGVEVRVRRADGLLAGKGEVGSIEVRSPFVAQGYYNQPDEASRKFRNGCCMTGDVGFVDEKGYLHVLGRAPDVVIDRDMAIGPTTIEEILCRLPDVRYATAFASNHASAGRTWIAVVEPWKGRRVNLAQCEGALEAALGTSVSNQVRIVPMDRVPQTEQGKVNRARIEAALLAGGDVPGPASNPSARYADVISS
ncbi:AMP-binding protein [Paraburkholderia fungorum]|uniref:AMP-binding protein n=1 Tax=Paraburkholderia fungorum TaxID=134537 RepID=UPI0038B8C059